MTSNYPPGVTGREYAIAGPDYERESDIRCPVCGGATMELGYRGDRWLSCDDQDHETTLPRDDEGPADPDATYDAERDRRMLSDEGRREG